MTSSMPAPRIDLGEHSPITQRIASSTLDLPQPFGPTTPVRPGLDAQLGGLDEALEAGKLEPLYLHLIALRPPSSPQRPRSSGSSAAQLLAADDRRR